MILLKSILIKLLSGLGGPLKWLASFLLERLITWVTDKIKTYIEKRERAAADKEALKKYEGVLKDENATQEDRTKATGDFLNRKP